MDKCQFFHRLTFWTIKSFLLPYFLFVEGLPCRRGILDILTMLSFLLCDTLWITCQFYLHHSTGFMAILYGQQVRGLEGYMCTSYICFHSYRATFDMRWIWQTICGWEGKCEPLDCDFINAALAVALRIPLMVPVSVTVWIKSSRLTQGQNSCYSADDILKLSFCLICIPLGYVPAQLSKVIGSVNG